MDIKYHESYNPSNTKYIVMHHAGGLVNDRLAHTQHLTAEHIDNAHKQRFQMLSSLLKWGGYNFYITKDGTVTQFRAIGEETAAQKGYNFNGYAISICLAGNFLSDERPTLEQILSLKNLMRQLPPVKVYNVVPHRYLQSTECNALPDNWGRKLYIEVLNEKLNIIMQTLIKILDILRSRKMGIKVGAQYMDCQELDTLG